MGITINLAIDNFDSVACKRVLTSCPNWLLWRPSDESIKAITRALIQSSEIVRPWLFCINDDLDNIRLQITKFLGTDAFEHSIYIHGDLERLLSQLSLSFGFAFIECCSRKECRQFAALVSDYLIEGSELALQLDSEAMDWSELQTYLPLRQSHIGTSLARFEYLGETANGTRHLVPEAFGTLRARVHQSYLKKREGQGDSPLALDALLREFRTALQHAGNSSTRDNVWPYRPMSQIHMPAILPDGRTWPKITIVTPSFNQGAYIEQTLLSVINQGYPNIEHIVIDGGSSDETPFILEHYRSHLAYYVSEKDRGQSHAINKGMTRATGDILTWLNSDDMLAPGALFAVALAFATHEVDFVSGVCNLYSDGKLVGQHMSACEDGPLPLDDILDLDAGWNAGQFFYQPEVFFARSIWERVGAYVNEALYYSMDYELWLRFAEAGARLHVIGRPLAWFRLHEQQKTHVTERFMQELRELRDAYLERTGRTLDSKRIKPDFSRCLRIAFINDVGRQYGAGIAHGRLANSVYRAGHKVVFFAFAGDNTHPLSESIEQEQNILSSLRDFHPDLVIIGNLHAAHVDPLFVARVSQQYPTFCVTHDLWLLTGRCAYPGSCEKYEEGCDEDCPTADEYPALAPSEIHAAWLKKKKMWGARYRPILLANSTWTATFARDLWQWWFPEGNSPRVEEFRLGVDTEVFQPLDRLTCRRLLGVPEESFVIVFSASSISDQRKGGTHLVAVLQRLKDLNITCLVIGYQTKLSKWDGIRIIPTGYVTDEKRLAMIYSAADIYIGPSLEETFGQVFIEAAACGTPVIAYPTTGIVDAVRDEITGWLADGVGIDYLESALLRAYHRRSDRVNKSALARVYAENEWSLAASYRRFFIALRRLGLVDQLGLPHRIHFPVVDYQATPLSTPSQTVAYFRWRPLAGLGDIEGPYESYHILHSFRWCFGPETVMEIICPTAGQYLLAFEYWNSLFENQSVSITIDNMAVGSFELRRVPPAETKIFSFVTFLQEGPNKVVLKFAFCHKPEGPESNDLRPLTLALQDLTVVALD